MSYLGRQHISNMTSVISDSIKAKVRSRYRENNYTDLISKWVGSVPASKWEGVIGIMMHTVHEGGYLIVH